MSREFNREVSVKELCSIIDIETLENKEMRFTSISDGNVGGEATICAYVKGTMPVMADNQLVITIKELDGYHCIITENPKYIIDKSMYSSRDDFKYKVPSYEEMMEDMKDWIENNRDLYSHNYTF